MFNLLRNLVNLGRETWICPFTCLATIFLGANPIFNTWLVNIQNIINYSSISWDGLWIPWKLMCRTEWSHVTLVQTLVTPMSPLMHTRSSLALLGWLTFGASSVPEGEADVCHCNFMLIERWDLFPISCSFSLPSTHSHYCIVVPCFYFFRFSTEKSTFSPHPIQMLFLTFICTFVAHFSSCYIPTGLCAGVKRGGAVCLHEISCCRKERQRRPME